LRQYRGGSNALVRLTAAAILAITVGACQTTEDADVALKTRYVGQDADQFFIENGPASAAQKLGSGSTLYVWSSGRRNVEMPGTATSTVQSFGSSSYVTTNYTPGGSIGLECQVSILVDPENVIREIKPHRDSIGMWQMSRCAEMFL